MSNVAETIIAQIGGIARVAILTGAKNFVKDEKSVRFQLPKSQYVTITLTASDLYDIKVQKMNARTFETKLIGEANDIFAEDLTETLERLTDILFKF